LNFTRVVFEPLPPMALVRAELHVDPALFECRIVIWLALAGVIDRDN
jgi:hypothetical protein